VVRIERCRKRKPVPREAAGCRNKH
jgi:hypothetical protein